MGPGTLHCSLAPGESNAPARPLEHKNYVQIARQPKIHGTIQVFRTKDVPFLRISAIPNYPLLIRKCYHQGRFCL